MKTLEAKSPLTTVREWADKSGYMTNYDANQSRLLLFMDKITAFIEFVQEGSIEVSTTKENNPWNVKRPEEAIHRLEVLLKYYYEKY
jgi:hypothetical protein